MKRMRMHRLLVYLRTKTLKCQNKIKGSEKMPIVEGLIVSTAPMVVKFLLDQIKNYRRSGKKTKEIEELKNALEPFKERFEVNEEELQKIKENAEKLSEKLTENGFDITNEMYQKWTLNFLDEKLESI